MPNGVRGAGANGTGKLAYANRITKELIDRIGSDVIPYGMARKPARSALTISAEQFELRDLKNQADTAETRMWFAVARALEGGMTAEDAAAAVNCSVPTLWRKVKPLREHLINPGIGS